MDIQTLKSKAEGSWPTILTATTGIDPELLDGKHHPCPLCGGTDRFRVFDDFAVTGGMICNQCHRDKNGDGLASIQWLNECELPEAIRLVEEHLGVRTSEQTPDISALLGPARRTPISFPEIHQHYTQTAAYPYLDESGRELFSVIRFEVKPEYADIWKAKTFRQRRPDGSWSIKDVRRVPYALPGILNTSSGAPVFIVEGEKDADRLAGLGLTATTAPGGAGNWESDWCGYFTERNVIILPDNDQPGRAHGERVARSLLPTARSVKLIELPGLPEKGDVSDWLDAGGDREQLMGLADTAPEWNIEEAEGEKPRFEIWHADELLAAEFENRYLIDGILVADQPCILAGPKKCLKTSMLLDLAVSLVAGVPFVGKFDSEGGETVLLMSGESGLPTLQDTLRRITASSDVKPEQVRNLCICDDIPRIDSADDMLALQALLEEKKPTVVLFDPAYLMISGDEAGNLFKMGDQLRRLSRLVLEANATPVLAHHLKKSLTDPYAPPELDQMSWAGFSEYARQWILLSRREAYKPGTGLHKLWYSVGGSAGHNELWAMQVDEGVFLDRCWNVQLQLPDEAFQEASDQKEEQLKRRQEKKTLEHAERIREALTGYPEGQAGTWIREHLGMNGKTFHPAIEKLVEQKAIVPCLIQKENRKKPYDGYRLT